MHLLQKLVEVIVLFAWSEHQVHKHSDLLCWASECLKRTLVSAFLLTGVITVDHQQKLKGEFQVYSADGWCSCTELMPENGMRLGWCL